MLRQHHHWKFMSPSTLVTMALAVLMPFRLVASAAEPVAVNVTLDQRVVQQPLSGRLFVFCSRDTSREPRMGPDWFKPEPFFALDVLNFKPGLTRIIDDRADGCPDRLSTL
ncbi:MAG TPA: hypothetical protein VFI31_21320, partial [Pirellulales bacterium]|nr:hypothetical protein [Pirellulales bacterium]